MKHPIPARSIVANSSPTRLAETYFEHKAPEQTSQALQATSERSLIGTSSFRANEILMFLTLTSSDLPWY